MRSSLTGVWRIDANAAEVLPTLLQSLRDRSWAVRDGAVTLLGEIGPPAASALPNARALLDDPVSYVQIDAGLAIWRIDGNVNDVLPVLTRIISDRDAEPDLRQFALAAIGEIGPPARPALAVLTEASEDESYQVRTAALESRRKIESK